MSQLQLTFNKVETKEEIEARRFREHWWNMHNFKLEPGRLVSMDSLIKLEDEVIRWVGFRKGYIVKVYEDHCVCWLPEMSDWIPELIGMVNFDNLDPVTEFGFEPTVFRKEYPAPDKFVWRGLEIKWN